MTVTFSQNPNGKYVLTIDGDTVVYKTPFTEELDRALADANLQIEIRSCKIIVNKDCDAHGSLLDKYKLYEFPGKSNNGANYDCDSTGTVFPHGPATESKLTNEDKRDEFVTNVLAILGDWISGMPDANRAMSEIKSAAEYYGLIGDE